MIDFLLSLSDVFLELLNMTIRAGWLALAVIVLRPILCKAPKNARCFMWALVGMRLVFPWKIESVLSLLPSSETISPSIVYSQVPTIQTGVPALNSAVNPIISSELAPDPLSSTYSPIQSILFVASVVWLVGVAALFIYAAVSYMKVRFRVRESVWQSENIYLCDRVDTPFIIGIIKPKIILPASMNAADREFVIYHERAHLERYDHLWKPFGFLLLSIHWFNPILWLCYILFCRDIELATDEKVINERGSGIKKAYSSALLDCSTQERVLSVCPLAFGETGVKGRIKSVLNYKKPTFWVACVSLILCVAVAVCFLTDPKDRWKSENYGIVGTSAAAEYSGVVFEVRMASINAEFPHIEVKWTNKTDKTLCYGEPYSLFRGDEELEVKENMAWALPLYTVLPGGEAGHVFNLDYYDISQNGSYRLESWFSFDGDSSGQKFRAYVTFTIDRRFSFVGKVYRGEEMVFEEGAFSSVIYTDEHIPEFKITDDNCHLLTNGTVESNTQWTDLGELESFRLTKPTWDELLSDSLWDSGYSAEALRKNNLNAFRIVNYELGLQAYLLEQTNGDIYIAYGYTDPFVIRWIFNMREMDYDYQYWDKNEPQTSYMFGGSPDPIPPTLTLFPEIKKGRFHFSSLSSYIPMGDYEINGDELVLTADYNTSAERRYVFRREGDGWVFDGKRSSLIPEYRFKAHAQAVSPVPDGARFTPLEDQAVPEQ